MYQSSINYYRTILGYIRGMPIGLSYLNREAAYPARHDELPVEQISVGIA